MTCPAEESGAGQPRERLLTHIGGQVPQALRLCAVDWATLNEGASSARSVIMVGWFVKRE